MSELETAALAYAAEGYAVLPLYSIKDGHCDCHLGKACTTAGKHPRTPSGKNDASTDPDQVRKWWKQWPYANIGLAVPEGMVVLDVDPRKGGNLEWLGYSAPVMAQTGGDGWHVWFKVSAGQKVKKLPGVDLREGGKHYVVAPPSIHQSGKHYQWAKDCALLSRTVSNILPDLILEEPPTKVASGLPSPAAGPKRWLAHYVTQTAIGNRSDTGLLLAQQLRDSERLSKDEAALWMLRYQAQVPQEPGRQYTEGEALRTLDQVYDNQTPREPAQEQFPALIAGPSDHLADVTQEDDFYVSQFDHPTMREFMRRSRTADAMPIEGPVTWAGTPSQVRRQAHYAVWLHIWQTYFPQDKLDLGNVSRWLVAYADIEGPGDEGTKLFDAFCKALLGPHQEIEHPRAWLDGVVSNNMGTPKHSRKREKEAAA
jgi:hypothetical protein